MKKTIAGTVIIIMSVVTVMLFYSFERNDHRFSKETRSYNIVQKWELPEVLNEVSAIEWIGNNKIAAVQDEDGTLFIYDLESKKIQDRIKFAGGGDYEGLRISGKDAYVLRSDGTIFHIQDYIASEPRITPIESSLTKIKDIDVEGLTLDEGKNRLLLAVKDKKGEKKTKGIYSLELKDRTSGKDPVFSIRLSDPVFGNAKNKFTPSEIDIHPVTGEYYMLDGSDPKLLILGKDGKPDRLHLLENNDFEKPEGLTFSPEGTLYISNEAGKGSANILQVNLE